MANHTVRDWLPLREQQERLLAAYPTSFCVVAGNVLTWREAIQPTPFSRQYRVALHYELGTRPTVTVLSPPIRALIASSQLPQRTPPHINGDPCDSLCLFLGPTEWNPTMALADTTVPWTSLWLRFFESWLFTNTWEGSGAS